MNSEKYGISCDGVIKNDKSSTALAQLTMLKEQAHDNSISSSWKTDDFLNYFGKHTWAGHKL